MTVNSTTNRVAYAGNGTASPLPVSFPFQAQGDLLVIKTVVASGLQTILALTTDYTITGTTDGNGFYPNGGNVVPGAVIPVGTNWTIIRDPELTQLVEHVDNDPLPAASIDNPVDKLTMITQRLSDRLDRAITIPDGDAALDMVVPAAPMRNGFIFGFDPATGVPALSGSTMAQVDALVQANSVAGLSGALGALATTATLLSLFPVLVSLGGNTTFVTGGRTASGDGGGGVFYYDASDTTTADNGGTVRVDGAGRRWKAVVNDGWVPITLFGAKADGVTDCTTAINAALATGYNVRAPGIGPYLVTGQLSMTTAYQTLAGHGPLTEIRFTYAGSAVGLVVSGSNGNQVVRDVWLNGTANVSKLIQIKSPEVTIKGNRLNNASGHVIYCEDENTGSGIYDFGLIVDGNIMVGKKTTGNYGIRFGLNAQGARVTNNVLQNCGTILVISNAAQNMIIDSNIFEDSVDQAILLDHGGSAPLMAGICIERNYFEGNQVCIHLNSGEFQDLSIRKNYATRGTASITASYFYWGDTGASAASYEISVEDNYVDSFAAVFKLDGEYTARLRRKAGNESPNCTAYAAGTYSDNSRSYRLVNGYFAGKLLTGSWTADVTRIQAVSASWVLPLSVESGDYIEAVNIPYVQVGGTIATIELHQVNGVTDTTLHTTTTSGDGTYTIPFSSGATGGYPSDKANHYYLKFTLDATGTGGYISPAQLVMRK